MSNPGKLISNVALGVMVERAETAAKAGISGPFTLDHSQFVGFYQGALDKKPSQDLFATSHYNLGSKALRCASSADPETVLELVRGYRLAKEAGLLKPAAERGNV